MPELLLCRNGSRYYIGPFGKNIDEIFLSCVPPHRHLIGPETLTHISRHS